MTAITADPTTSLLENLASYVPRVVMRYAAEHPQPLSEPSGTWQPSAVLFADISGFTALSERLAKRGPEGVENLSVLLNTYFGQLIEIVMDYEGDIVEFTGDGIIVLWSTPPEVSLTDAVMQASACALAVQRGLMDYLTAESLSLSLRVSVGAGDVLIAYVGGILGRWELLAAGDPLVQVGEAQHQAHPGDVVLSPQAWALIRDCCQGEALPEGGTRLHSVPPDVPRPEQPPVPLTREMIEPLGGFLPGAILNRLEAGLTDWLAELRYVTVLFISVYGLNYTSPDIVEKLHEVMRALQSALYQYEGSVNQFIVDDKGTIMVAGLGLPPLTHEDDATRGVQAALTMHSQLRALGMDCAIGVSTGWVFCGARGHVRRRDYALIGDVMNLAARLMQVAEQEAHQEGVAPILCDGATYEAAHDRLAFDALPPITVKGKSSPIVLYRPLGRERASVRRQTAIVGRQAERALLTERLQVLQRGEEGSVIIIEGDTGMGKSRLVSNLVAQAQALGVSCLMGMGDAVERATPYHAWRPIFWQLFDMDSMAGDDLLTRRIRVLNRLWIDPETARLSPLINAVLPLDVPENRMTAQMSGQVRADNTRALLLRVLRNMLAHAPVLLVLDEAHWLDSASWALALAAVQRLHPLMLVVATRPLSAPLPVEYQQLMRRGSTHRLVLDSLSPDDTVHLVCQQLGVNSLPDEVARIISEKSQGNPFFSEELAYTMRDTGLIIIDNGECRIAPGAGELSAISFPASVQGVVISRIDRLIPSQQLTLKVASVIGQIFALRTLSAVYPIEPDRPNLPDYLRTLEHLNITALAAPEPDLTYIFKHIIIQEVVYNLLLFSQRRELHRAVAEWYEQTYTSDLETYYPVLAHHWHKAEVQHKAIDYLEKAGEQALGTYANREAVGFFEEVLTLAQQIQEQEGRPPPQRDGEPEAPAFQLAGFSPLRQARWERRLGEAYLGLGQLAESRQHLERAVELLQRPLPTSRRKFTTRTLRQALRQTLHRLHTSRRERSPAESEAMLETARAYESLLVIYFFANETLAATYTSLLTLNLAERAAPSVELARSYANMCLATGSLALHPLAQAYCRQALRTAEQVGDQETQAYVRNSAGLYYVGAGNWEEARMALEEAVDICEQLGARRLWGACWTLLAQLAYYEGDFPRADEMFAQLYTEAQNYGDVLQQAWALGGQGQNRLRLGLFDDACAFLERANRKLADNQELPSQISNYGLLAVAHLRQGDTQRARDAAETAARLLQSVPVPAAYYLLEGYSGFAEVYLTLWEQSGGQTPAARRPLVQHTRQACDALAQYARLFAIGQPRMLLWRGLHIWLNGRPHQAHQTWQAGLDAARSLHMPYEEGLTHYELGRHLSGAARREHLHHAADIFQRLGAVGDLDRTQRLL